MPTTQPRLESLRTAGFDFSFVPPADIPDILDAEVLPRLRRFIVKNKLEWREAKVVKSLIDGDICLGVVQKSGKIVGITITSEMTDAFTDIRGLFVWLLSLDNLRDSREFMRYTVDALASVLDYSFVRAVSARPGWQKYLTNGWAVMSPLAEKRYG